MGVPGTKTLDKALSVIFGEAVRVVSRHPVYGGDINRAYRLALSDGTSVFLKCNTPGNLSFFTAEAKGLEALRRPGTIGVPEPLAFGTDRARGLSFLLLEYLSPIPRISRYWETFGHELAALHRADCGGLVSPDPELRFGFAADNYIGATPQKNTPKADWLTFYRDCRLTPQIERAAEYFDPGTRAQCTRLLDRLDRYLPEPPFQSLLHGDLWSGNNLCGPDGRAWIFDPAAYVGHFEAELAMTELFGGYPEVFYRAYHEENPTDSGYRSRRDIYNLYHLLNHLNLFGGAYYSPVRKILRRYA